MSNHAPKLGPLVPWLALAAVSAFALVLLANRGGERGTATPPPVAETPAATTPVPALEAARAAETALDAALQENAALEAQAAQAARERDAAVERADAAEALVAVQAERLQAFETTLADAEDLAGRTQGVLDAMTQRVEDLEARRAAAEDRVLRWLRDVAAEEPELRARALEGIGRADAEDVQRLAALVEEDPTRAEAVARLLAGVEPSDATDAAAVAALGAGLDPGTLPAAVLVRPAVVAGALATEDPVRRRALVEALARHAARVAPDDRLAVAAAVAPLLDAASGVAAPAARLVGILRGEGAAPALAALLGASDASVRAAAAYALSRVPDRATADATVRAALPALLADEDLGVRIAAVLLAEAVLGESVAFDPAAAPEARAKAREALLQRL